MQIKEEKISYKLLIFENFIFALDDQKLIRYKYVGDPN